MTLYFRCFAVLVLAIMALHILKDVEAVKKMLKRKKQPPSTSVASKPINTAANGLMKDALAKLNEGNTQDALDMINGVLKMPDLNEKQRISFLGLYTGVLISTRSWKEGLEKANTLIALANTDARAHFQKGIALHSLERNSEALLSFDEALLHDPTFGQARETAEKVRQLIRSNPKSSTEEHRIADQGELAQSEFQESAHNISSSLTAKGTQLIGTERQTEALYHFARAIDVDPTASQPHALAASILHAIGSGTDTEEAIEQSMLQATAGSQHLRALFHDALYIAKQNLTEGNTEETLKMSERIYLDATSITSDALLHTAITLDPKNIHAVNLKADKMAWFGDFESALKVYETLCESPLAKPVAKQAMGRLLRIMGRHEEALSSFSESMDADNKVGSFKTPELYFEMGNTLQYLERYHEATEHYRKCTKADDKENNKYREHRGYCFFETGKINEASEKYFKSSISAVERTRKDLPLMRINGTLNPHIDYASLDYSFMNNDQPFGESGLIWVDEILSSEVLKDLRETILHKDQRWNKINAFIYQARLVEEQLASPLLLQIASDIRSHFPKILRRHFLSNIRVIKKVQPHSNLASLDDHSDGYINAKYSSAGVHLVLFLSKDDPKVMQRFNEKARQGYNLTRNGIDIYSGIEESIQPKTIGLRIFEDARPSRKGWLSELTGVNVKHSKVQARSNRLVFIDTKKFFSHGKPMNSKLLNKSSVDLDLGNTQDLEKSNFDYRLVFDFGRWSALTKNNKKTNARNEL